ncbi:hypothetical protein [Alkalibacterium sp. MB6]|uniref:hypothetical protein n=1 Tax=Alkalibacterium sp. MB6 TaxID=2081965 RepID=UPI001379BB93|nr:hypothetical protein [Alkalibacterium sp. MB6]
MKKSEAIKQLKDKLKENSLNFMGVDYNDGLRDAYTFSLSLLESIDSIEDEPNASK